RLKLGPFLDEIVHQTVDALGLVAGDLELLLNGRVLEGVVAADLEFDLLEAFELIWLEDLFDGLHVLGRERVGLLVGHLELFLDVGARDQGDRRLLKPEESAAALALAAGLLALDPCDADKDQAGAAE